jgi:hypothetical protein
MTARGFLVESPVRPVSAFSSLTECLLFCVDARHGLLSRDLTLCGRYLSGDTVEIFFRIAE